MKPGASGGTRHRIRGVEIEVSERSPIPTVQQRGRRRADHEGNAIAQWPAGILHRRDQIERAQDVPTIDLIVPDHRPGNRPMQPCRAQIERILHDKGPAAVL